MYYMRSKRGVDTTVDAEGCYEEAQCKLARRQKRGWSGKALWPLGKDWPVSRFLPISRFHPGGFLPKLTLNDTEIMRDSHFPPSIPLRGHTERRLGLTAQITRVTTTSTNSTSHWTYTFLCILQNLRGKPE